MSAETELLMLAARAAGITWPGEDGAQLSMFNWNPIENDGDALRLAVELRIAVSPHGGSVAAQRAGWPMVTEEFKGDRHKATRLAIVRAAAGMITSMTNNSGKAHCPHCGICHASEESCFEAKRRIDSIGARHEQSS